MNSNMTCSVSSPFLKKKEKGEPRLHMVLPPGFNSCQPEDNSDSAGKYIFLASSLEAASAAAVSVASCAVVPDVAPGGLGGGGGGAMAKPTTNASRATTHSTKATRARFTDNFVGGRSLNGRLHRRKLGSSPLVPSGPTKANKAGKKYIAKAIEERNKRVSELQQLTSIYLSNSPKMYAEHTAERIKIPKLLKKVMVAPSKKADAPAVDRAPAVTDTPIVPTANVTLSFLE